MATYRMRYFFDFGCQCLWSANEAANERFGYAIEMSQLPLPKLTVDRVNEVADWYMKSLNCAYAPDPGPWRQPECDRFNEIARELLDEIRKELGPDFEVVNEQVPMVEDPDLDAYLADPKGFRRKT